MLQPFPSYDAALADADALTDLKWIKQAIVAVRTMRAEMNIAPGKPLAVLLRQASLEVVRRVHENLSFMLTLARLDSITLLPADDKGPVSITPIIDGAELLIPMAGLVYKDAELDSMAKESARIDGEISRIAAKLGNEGFIGRAPEAVVAKESEKLESYQQSKAKLLEQQAIIAGL